MGANGECSGVSCCPPSTVPDCSPIHRVSVDEFWMDATEVTNAQFAKFVDATGYVTVAKLRQRKPTSQSGSDLPLLNWVGGAKVALSYTP